MITAVIVEDEKVIRDGLKKHVPWESLGISEVYTASQAEEAIDLCKKVKLDIVVSDIRMPGMNGIELCRKIREEQAECKVIFVTGFSDKEYLKAAIALQAVSYVEKPVNIKEISVALSNAVDQIKKSRVYKQAVVRSVFTKSDQLDYKWSNDTFFSVGMLYLKENSIEKEAENNLRQLIEKTGQENGFHIYSEQINERTLAFLFSDIVSETKRLDNLRCMIKKIIENEPNKCFFTWGKEVDSQKAVKQSYQSAERAKLCLGYKGWNTVSDYTECPCKLTNSGYEKSILNNFEVAVTQNDIKKAMEIVIDLTKEIQERCVLLDMDIRYWYYYMEAQIFRMSGIRKDEGTSGQQIEKLETVKELETYICSLLKQESADNKNYYIAQKVSEYIREHYGEKDLSIKTLADKVYLTPTYLSNLYKKQTGITIGQYLVDIRVERAVQLLKDPQWKLYQIAPMVGYEDPNYFAKIFKKKKGITPSEYREKMVR